VYASEVARAWAKKQSWKSSKRKRKDTIRNERARFGWSATYLDGKNGYSTKLKSGVVSKEEVDEIHKQNEMYLDRYGSYDVGPLAIHVHWQFIHKRNDLLTDATWMSDVGNEGNKAFVAARQQIVLDKLAPSHVLPTTVSQRSSRYRNTNTFESVPDYFGRETHARGPQFKNKDGSKIRVADLLDSDGKVVTSFGMVVVRSENFKEECAKLCHHCNCFASACRGKGMCTKIELRSSRLFFNYCSLTFSLFLFMFNRDQSNRFRYNCVYEQSFVHGW